MPCLPQVGVGGDVSMPPAGSSPLWGTGIGHKALPSPPPAASTPPNPVWGPGSPSPALVPGQILPAAQPGCWGMIWGTGTSAGGPAVPAALGELGLAPASHLPPCNLLGELSWLLTCQGASPVPSWGCWLCPGQAHPLGCQTGRDTWRHLETRSEISVHPQCCSQTQGCALCLLPRPCSPCPAPHACSTFPLPVPCCLCLLFLSCSPFPSPRSPLPMPLSPFPSPHSPLPVPLSLFPLPIPCSPLPAPHSPLPMPPIPCRPCSAALAGGHRSCGAGPAGLVGTVVRSVCAQVGDKGCAMSVPWAGALRGSLGPGQVV